MSFFIADAYAQAEAAQPGPPGLEALIFPVLLFVVFYFVLIRPQAKRQKEQRKMVESLTKGDEVVTSGGVLGKVTKVGDAFVNLEIAEGVQIKVQKHTLNTMMPKGTIKSV